MNLDNFEVARTIFTNHRDKPCLTIKYDCCYVNRKALTLFPDQDFIKILISNTEKYIVFIPTAVSGKDIFRWTSSGEKRKPRVINDPILFSRIFHHMGWDPQNKYILIGEYEKKGNQTILAFNLAEPKIYKASSTNGHYELTASFPTDMLTNYGVKYKEHDVNSKISTFDGLTVFEVDSTIPLKKSRFNKS